MNIGNLDYFGGWPGPAWGRPPLAHCQGLGLLEPWPRPPWALGPGWQCPRGILEHSGAFWSILCILCNLHILEHSGVFWGILEQSDVIFILEQSGTFWSNLVQHYF